MFPKITYFTKDRIIRSGKQASAGWKLIKHKLAGRVLTQLFTPEESGKLTRRAPGSVTLRRVFKLKNGVNSFFLHGSLRRDATLYCWFWYSGDFLIKDYDFLFQKASERYLNVGIAMFFHGKLNFYGKCVLVFFKLKNFWKISEFQWWCSIHSQ